PSRQLAVGNRTTLQDTPEQSLHEAMLSLYDQYYSADNMKLVMVSRHSLDELEALARKHFSQVPNRHIDKPTARTPGPTQAHAGQHIYYRPPKDLKQIDLEC